MEESFALFLLKCLYFMLPAYFANMAPVLVKKINLFVVPIDFNKKIKNKPILGSHKTFRGLIFGVLFAIIISYIQFRLYSAESFRSISFFDYQNWLLFGFLMGFGALAGDTVKSFFKRRTGIRPGDKFIPFDQIDFVVGAFAFTAPIFGTTFKIILVSLFLAFFLHVLANHLAFYLKIRKEKW